jgi:hypothetical protein
MGSWFDRVQAIITISIFLIRNMVCGAMRHLPFAFRCDGAVRPVWNGVELSKLLALVSCF